MELRQVQKEHSEEIVEQKKNHETNMNILLHRHINENAALQTQLTCFRVDQRRWLIQKEEYERQLLAAKHKVTELEMKNKDLIRHQSSDKET